MSTKLTSIFFALTVVGSSVAPALEAAPSAKDKMLATLLTAAQKAFDAAEFSRAAELYLDLWRQDASQPLYLYNAGRASHLGGQLDRAEDIYRQLLALPGLEQTRIDKTRGYIVEVQRRKGEHKAEEAAQFERKGKYDAAATTYSEAFELDSTRHAWLARAGRSLHLAGRRDDAGAAYRKFLKGAPKEAPDRAEVEGWLRELGGSAGAAAAPQGGVPSPGGAAAPAAGAAPGAAFADPTVTATAAAPGTPLLAWIALGGGAALTAGGAVLFLGAQSDADALQAELDASKHDVSGKAVIALDYDHIRDRNDAIAQSKTIGAAVAGVGVVSMGVGAWLALTAPKAQVAFAPAPDLGGVRMAWRF